MVTPLKVPVVIETNAGTCGRQVAMLFTVCMAIYHSLEANQHSVITHKV